ncbi:MAG: O-antigen ligase family protein [Patescibacteria group bacterium]
MSKFFTWPRNLDEYLLLFIKIGLFLSLFAPLVIGHGFYFPYIVPRNLYWRLIIEIIFCLYLFLLARSNQWRPKANFAWTILLLFVLALSISSILGPNPAFSFWSNFERMDGLVTWYHILMYVVILLGVLQSDRNWRTFFGASLLVAWLVALYGLAQEFSFGLSFIQPSSGGSRLTASLGNAAYVGSYMFLHIVVAAWLWFSNLMNNYTKRWINLFYIVSIFLFSYVLIVTQTRGAFLGLLLFAWLLAISYLWFSKKRRPWFYYFILVVSLASVLSVSLIFIQKDKPWVQDVPLFSKLASISITNDITTQSRLLIWKNSLSGFRDKPIFGWGLENFHYVFNKYFPTKIFHDASSETWFDRPHNILVQHLIDGGALGFLLYLSIFVYLITILFKKHRQGDHWLPSYFWIIFLISFLFQDFFIFDSVNTNVIFYLILAYLLTRPAGKQTTIAEQVLSWRQKVKLAIKDWGLKATDSQVKKYFFGILCLALMFFMVWNFVYKPYHANTLLYRSVRQAMTANTDADAEQAKNFWQESWDTTILGDKEKVQLLPDMFAQVVNNQNLNNQIKDSYFNLVNDNLSSLADKYPNDVRLNMFLSNFYSVISQVVPSLSSKNVAILERIHAWAPLRPDIYLHMTNAYLMLGDIDSAKKIAAELKSLVTWTKEPYWNEFLVDFRAGDISSMASNLQAIKSFNQKESKIDFDANDQAKINYFIELATKNKQTAVLDLLK